MVRASRRRLLVLVPKRRAPADFEEVRENAREDEDDDVQLPPPKPTMAADAGRAGPVEATGQETTLPLLAQLARMVLSVAASSSSSERVLLQLEKSRRKDSLLKQCGYSFHSFFFPLFLRHTDPAPAVFFG